MGREGVELVRHMGREMGGAIVSGGQSLRQEGVELEWGMVGRWAGYSVRWAEPEPEGVELEWGMVGGGWGYSVKWAEPEPEGVELEWGMVGRWVGL